MRESRIQQKFITLSNANTTLKTIRFASVIKCSNCVQANKRSKLSTPTELQTRNAHCLCREERMSMLKTQLELKSDSPNITNSITT